MPNLLLFRLLVCFLEIVVAAPVMAQQSTRAPRVAVLLAAILPQSPEAEQFRQGLRDLGYAEGRDVLVEWRSAEGDYARLPALLAETIEAEPDIVVVEGTVAALRAKEAMPTTPLVMAVVGDPLAAGLIGSLVQPGGSITGLSMMASDIATKRLQLLKEAIPTLKRVGVLSDASIPWHAETLVELTRAARKLGVQMTTVRVKDADAFVSAFSQIRRARVQAVYMLDSALLGSHSVELLKLAAEARLPVACGRSKWAEQGALLSYSADFGDMFRRTARYVDRILKGAKPGDLPVEQPTKFELVLNLKTAKTLGLKISEPVLMQANEVIR
jgi:putative tryptophan/tyrosine transport system substrate-binding protein